MFDLLLAFGVAFILRGIMFICGRTVPNGVIERLSYDKEKLKGWCQGTGIVHCLWGSCMLFIWLAQKYTRWNFQFLCNAVIVAITSMIVSYITTKKYGNKKDNK